MDNEELARELKVLREKIRAGEDVALSERRRSHELASAYDEARAARATRRGF